MYMSTLPLLAQIAVRRRRFCKLLLLLNDEGSMIIFSNSSISSMGRSALNNVHARGIQRNGLATVRIYIFEYRPMSTHTGTHHAPRSDSELCLTHLHKYPDPQVRFPTVLPTGKPTKIHGLPRVATCLNLGYMMAQAGHLLALEPWANSALILPHDVRTAMTALSVEPKIICSVCCPKCYAK